MSAIWGIVTFGIVLMLVVALGIVHNDREFWQNACGPITQIEKSDRK